ncbi:MAG: hypothetical protein ACI4AD_11890 [Roseburia sp.]
MKKYNRAILVLTACMMLNGCGSDDITDQVANVVQAENPNVLGVKEGTNSAYPGMTYGEAFDSFFGSPTWKYFQGTKEGLDENGDGEPDYVEENVDVVEFTGYCTYHDVEVKALIQFTLDNTEGTFEATYLSFNDVPQDELTLLALLNAVFTNGDAAEVSENPETEEMDSENDYELLPEYIELICSFSDPPDLQGDALEAYYKEEYDAWKRGEGCRFIIVDETGHLKIDDHSAEYSGEWSDTYSERCHMSIQSDGIYYQIDINWSSSACENTHWQFWGTYDSTLGAITYTGYCIEEYYPGDGEVQETYTYTDGTGLIYMGNDGMLYWIDDIQNQGENCAFAKVQY